MGKKHATQADERRTTPLRQGILFRREGHSLIIYPDQPLSLALEKMGEAGIDVLPVVSRADVHTLLGVVTLGETLDAYGVGRGTL